jgi:dethiobiotin synthetase
MKGYFITGTDTGVGKTHVARLLARTGVIAGKHVFAFKPVETGCPLIRNQLVGGDGEALAVAAGDWQQGALRGPYRFALAAAPFVAAGVNQIDLEEITRCLTQGSAGADLVLVEGAGGWRVPLTATHDMSELARITGWPVLVVARATLGTINHSLLTLEAIERDELPVAALILSKRPGDNEFLARSNQEQLQARTKVPVELLDTETDLLTRFT